MAHELPRVARLIADTPWAILPEKLEAICAFLELRIAGTQFSAEEMEARIERPARVAAKPGAVGVLPIFGTMSQRANMMSDISGGVSTEVLRSQFADLVNNSDIKAIVLNIDSPGGSVFGVEELAADVFAARGTKPIVAVANSLMASAAYWVGSQADEIVATPGAITGSIGVYAIHEDISQAAEAAGFKYTVVKAGKYKAEGIDVLPLDEEALGAMQARADSYYSLFTKAVARGRGVPESSVRTGYGEGRALTAQASKEAGLVDRIATLDQTLARLGASMVTTPSSRADVERLWDIALTKQPGLSGAICQGGDS